MHSRSPRARRSCSCSRAPGPADGSVRDGVAAAPRPPPPACAVARHPHEVFEPCPTGTAPLLDQTYRLASSPQAEGPPLDREPPDSTAGTRFASSSSPTSRRWRSGRPPAGARFSVQSAYRSYSTQMATFASWVRLSGYARAGVERPSRAQRAPAGDDPRPQEISWERAMGYRDWGKTKAGTWLRTTPGIRLRDVLSEGQDP